jgi:hypothetical protein
MSQFAPFLEIEEYMTKIEQASQSLQQGDMEGTKTHLLDALANGEAAYEGQMDQYDLNEQEEAQLALPEPPARDYLGDDGKDYEGGMAKSQLNKMKKYADALCNMVDDESQLEAWVQAKLTKASDYMSAVYHYLDYQNSKMNNE